MKNNIDEDIKIYEIELNKIQAVNVLTNDLNKFEIKGEHLYIHKKAIENVLSELSNLKWKNEIYVKSIKSHKETIEKQDKELETYKKIADLLADELLCMKFRYGSIFLLNKKELLDWARKEVENGK